MCSDVYLFIYKLLCKQGGTNEELKKRKKEEDLMSIYSATEKGVLCWDSLMVPYT